MPSLKELLNSDSLKSGGSYLSDLADTIVNLPTNLQRVVTHPQIFNKIIGYNPMQKETGFAAAATGLPPKQEYAGGILNPPNLEYEKGYESGEPVAIAAGAAPFAIPIGRSAGKALAPKMYQMAEDYMVKTGGLIPATEWKSIPVGRSKETPMEIAQKNAALPVSEGGLGLPVNNTAADRAKAMGYEIPVYHGTNQDIPAFNVEGKGKTSGAGAFLTTNPTTAETYVSSSGGGNILPLLLKKDDFLTTNARGRNWSDIWTDQLSAKSKSKKYNLDDLSLDKYSATSTDELGMIAKDLGLKGAQIKNVKDLGPNSHVMRAKEYLLDKYGVVPDETWSNVTGKQWDEAQKAMKKFYESQKSDIYAIQDPSLVRSRFAAFDPKLKDSPNLLAGMIPFGLIKTNEDEQKNR